jgi:hypothetical protein
MLRSQANPSNLKFPFRQNLLGGSTSGESGGRGFARRDYKLLYTTQATAPMAGEMHCRPDDQDTQGGIQA